MKKQLLLAAFLMGGFFTASAQELNYDFNALTTGNISTDATGETAGNGDWYVFANNGAAPTTSTNMGVATFQVVDNGAEHGNVIQAIGPNGDKGAGYLWQAGTQAWWEGRSAGNNIVQVRYEYFTGETSNSMNAFRVVMFNNGTTQQDSRLLAGITVSANTLAVSGLAHYTDTPGTGTYIFGLGATAQEPLVLEENTWVTLGFDYNYTTGEVTFVAPGYTGAPIAGAAAQNVPGEIDMMVISGSTQTTANTASATGLFDNLSVELTGGTAGTEDFVASTLAVFPNPATNVINVTNTEVLNNVQIVDLNGRTVKSVKVNATEAQINISDLSAGVYMMNIATDKGTTTKKIVKN